MQKLLSRSDEPSLYDAACAAQKLFTTDRETRSTFGGMPYFDDLLTEIDNREEFARGEPLPKRRRIRLGQLLREKNGQPLAYIGYSVVDRAPLIPYELKYVWGGKGPTFADGLFVRRLVVRKDMRGRGYGAHMLRQAHALAHELGKRTYLDTKAGNAPMRALARSLGGMENMFWHTPSDTLMVRYIWL